MNLWMIIRKLWGVIMSANNIKCMRIDTCCKSCLNRDTDVGGYWCNALRDMYLRFNKCPSYEPENVQIKLHFKESE